MGWLSRVLKVLIDKALTNMHSQGNDTKLLAALSIPYNICLILMTCSHVPSICALGLKSHTLTHSFLTQHLELWTGEVPWTTRDMSPSQTTPASVRLSPGRECSLPLVMREALPQRHTTALPKEPGRGPVLALHSFWVRWSWAGSLSRCISSFLSVEGMSSQRAVVKVKQNNGCKGSPGTW